ncbi:MAG: GNAT family N-acetyltransferase [Acidimicrobiia bacterium]
MPKSTNPAGTVKIRPLGPDDADSAYSVMVAAFSELGERLGLRAEPWPPPATGRLRIEHLAGTDPGGAWMAVDGDGGAVGCALALMREGLWGLSLLVVRPDDQSRGIGRGLLDRAWSYGDGARGAVILSSPDRRALRAYARLGLALHPTVTAKGQPRRVTMPPGIRPGSPDDLELTAAIDRKVRGAAHGPDIEALTRSASRMLVLPGRGYVIVREGDVRLLAAADEDAAVLLLRAALAAAGDREATVEWITAGQNWAVGPCLDAGLELHTNAGAVFLGGDVGPFTAYLPNGAYL